MVWQRTVGCKNCCV